MSDWTIVEITVDAAGYVLVEGARVPNDWRGEPLKHRPTFEFRCQRCGRPDIVVPTRVVRRPDICVPGGFQYHHACATTPPHRCARCSEAT